MQPKRLHVPTPNEAAFAFVHAAQPGTASGNSPAVELQQLIEAHYAVGAGNAPSTPLPARLAIMFSLSALLWAGIAVAVRLAIG